MIGEAFAYGLSALSAIGAIMFGLKQASTSDKSGLASRLSTVETTAKALERRVQMLERREVWHERKEGILTDALVDAGVPVPEMPPAPEAWVA